MGTMLKTSKPRTLVAEVAFLLSLLTLTHACCIPIEQTVRDPERVWERAFSQKPPANIHVRNGYHWSSGHFSGEYAWFIEVEADPKIIGDLVKDTGLVKCITAAEKEEARLDIWTEAPDWFAPPNQDYMVYRDPETHYVIFVLEGSKVAYLSRWSV